jgi:hypothetical protein
VKRRKAWKQVPYLRVKSRKLLEEVVGIREMLTFKPGSIVLDVRGVLVHLDYIEIILKFIAVRGSGIIQAGVIL